MVMLTTLTDATLLRQIAYGDEGALSTLYGRYSIRVYIRAHQITGDHMLAEEVVQDVFHQIWQAAPTFQGERPFINWCMAITYHRAVDATRSRRYGARAREVRLEVLEADTGQDIGLLDRILMTLTLGEAIKTLTQIQREVVTRAYLRGYTHAQIATDLGCPVGTIKTRLHTSLMALRARFEDENAH